MLSNARLMSQEDTRQAKWVSLACSSSYCRCPIWYCSRTTRWDCLKSFQSDLTSYHPYQYPDINLRLTLDVTSLGSCLLRYAQNTKQWNRYNSCYIYHHNQLHLITIRDVERLGMWRKKRSLYYRKERRTGKDIKMGCYMNMHT
jgi:hypothetical protein